MASGTRLTGTTLKPVQKARTGVATCPACGRRLSAYNAGPACYAHTVEVPWKGPTARPR